jgi:hypothetical protein
MKLLATNARSDMSAILTWTRQECQGEMAKASRFGVRVLAATLNEAFWAARFFVLQAALILVSIKPNAISGT